MPELANNDWGRAKGLVQDTLSRLEAQQERTTQELTSLRIAFEGFSKGMDVKASVWGLLGGLLPAIGVLLVLVLRS